MKKIIPIILLNIALMMPAMTYADSTATSFGIGGGMMYSGLGVNYGVKNSDTFKYLSFGTTLLGYGSQNGLYSDFGVGAGYVTTQWSTNNKHGLGVDARISYSRPDYKSEGVSFKSSISYLYFFNNLTNPGWNIGLTLGIGYYNNEIYYIGPFSVGYQF